MERLPLSFCELQRTCRSITALFKAPGSLFYLLVLLSFPMPIKAVRRFNKNDTPATMMPAMAATGKTNTIFGLLYALGIYISALLGGL